jgi:hypothetical protein
MAECWGKDFPVESNNGVSGIAIRLVSLAVADVVNDTYDNEYYGSVTRLAEKVGTTRETVVKSLQHLVSAGVLAVIEERPGRTTRYRWMGVPTTPPNEGVGNADTPQPVGNADRYLSGAPTPPVGSADTNPIEPKSDPRTETQTPAGAGVVTLGSFGEDPDREETDPSKAPSRVAVEHLLSSWYDMVSLRKIHTMVPRVPNRVAAYKYLNTNFFKPKEGGPFPASSVIAMVDDFINKVEYGNIEVKGNAWSTFVFYANRLNTQPQDTYVSPNPTTIEELWEKYGTGVDEPPVA